MIFGSRRQRRLKRKAKKKLEEPEEEKSASNPWLGSLLIILAALLLISIGLYFRYQSLFVSCIGIYFWLIGGGVVCGLRLLQLTHYILPNNNRELAHELLSNSFLSEGRKRGHLPAQLPPSFHKLGVGLIPSDQLLLISQFKNPIPEIIGPGFVQIPKGYTVKELVSLVPQTISKNIDLTSSDGYPLKTVINIEFQIVTPAQNSAPYPNLSPLPYSYDEQAIYKLLYSSSKGTHGEHIAWNERVMRPIQSAVLAEVRKYRLDQLIGASESDSIHFHQIEDSIKKQFTQLCKPIFDYLDPTQCPIQLNNFHIHPFSPGEEIDRQMIHQWQSKLIQQIHLLPEPEQIATKQQAQMAIFDHLFYQIEQDAVRFPERILELTVFHLTKEINFLLEEKEIQSLLPTNWLGLWHKIHDLIYPQPSTLEEKGRR